MKHTKYTRSLGAGFLLGAFALLSGPVGADEGDKATPVPDSPAAIWQAIDAQVKALDDTVASGKLGDVHHHAFAVRDLVKALPSHSKDMDPAALAKVQANSKFVDTLAERLDKTGDANDVPATKANLDKFKHTLASIRANYPATAAKP